MAKNGFTPEFMEELKARNDIIEIAGQYLSLDKRGYQYWACCPFHHEKTPSFAIRADEQYYHCFGCGVSGDVVSFVQELESVTFPEAVKILADRAKMPMPEMNYDSERTAELKRKKDRLLQILLTTARFYLKNLYGGKASEHIDYISNRNLSPSIVKKFGLGASLDYNTLPSLLLDSGFTQEEILDSGVCSMTEKGRLFDAQAGRLIIPIINAFDEVIAFGGRIIGKKTDGVAKYKNTRETMLFNKRKTLYNINLLKKFKQSNPLPYIIMVEGYMDTISLYQAGFQNVVASMGTSLTPEQARMLKRYSDSVFISYDGDFAGQNADLRGLEILREEDLKVKVVLMPEGDDPDDVVKKQGAAGYQKCLDEAMPFLDYKLHSLGRKYDVATVDGKRDYVKEAVEIIRGVESAAVREDLVKTVQKKTGYSTQALLRDVDGQADKQKPSNANGGNAGGGKQITPVALTQDKSDRILKAERFIIGSVLFKQPYASDYELRVEEFSDGVHKTIIRYINDCKAHDKKIRAVDLFEVFGEDTAEFSQILNLNTESGVLGENASAYFDDCVRTVEKRRVQDRITKVKDELSRALDVEKRKLLMNELNELTKKLKR